ncbi:MAG: hypothetical protein M3297_00625, partial [Thermoproteota archaeon]|nr:hypothetical protein [Thermoproteota archaeon]
MEDKPVKNVNVDNHNIPINIFSAPTNFGSDIYNFKSASSSPTIHFTTYLSYNTILQNQYEKQYYYQNQQRQLQLEQQQKQQLYNTGARDYYNYGKTAKSNLEEVSNNPTSTMAATTSLPPSLPPSPPLPSTPLPAISPVLNVPGDIYVEATSSAGAHVNYVVSAKAILPAPGSSGSAASGRDVQQQEVTLSPQCSPPSGSLFSIGTTTVTCTVSDRYNMGSNGGAAESKTFKVIVRDTTAPALTLPADNLVIKATDNT